MATATCWRLVAALCVALASGPATADADARIAVTLPADDLAHMLEDMREWLEINAGIVDGLALDDVDRVRALAAGMRPPLARARRLAEGPDAPVPGPSAPPGPRSVRDLGRFERMQNNLPPGYRHLMYETRRAMADLEARAEAGPRETLARLARVQQLCVACHRAYRLQPAP